jgi:hypothetical protein
MPDDARRVYLQFLCPQEPAGAPLDYRNDEIVHIRPFSDWEFVVSPGHLLVLL